MDRENSKKLISKIIYWVISSFIIILLFFVLFGVLPLFIEHINLNAISVIGFIIGGIGAAIIIISLYSPLFLTKHFMKIDPNKKSQYNTRAISFVYGLIGVFLLLGGLVYSFTGNSTYLVLLFITPIIFLAILNKILSRKK